VSRDRAWALAKSQTRYRVTALIETNALLLSQATTTLVLCQHGYSNGVFQTERQIYLRTDGRNCYKNCALHSRMKSVLFTDLMLCDPDIAFTKVLNSGNDIWGHDSHP